MSYKNEVFLIKGRYYSTVSSSSVFFFLRYGAVEGSLTVDETVGVKAFDPFCHDVLIKKRGHKWGLFPLVYIHTEGNADWASDDNNPFIYDSFKILCHEDVERGNELFDSFILLNEGNKWHAVRIDRGEGVIHLNNESGLETNSDTTLLEAIEEKYKMRLKFRDLIKKDNDKTISQEKSVSIPEFDLDKDFRECFKRYDDISVNTCLIRLILSGTKNNCGINGCLLYAVAHKSPHAAILIGKQILEDVTERITEDKKSGDDCFRSDDSYYNKMLNCSIEYFRLAKHYSDESGDTTLSDIAWVYLTKAESVYRGLRPLRKRQTGQSTTTPPV